MLRGRISTENIIDPKRVILQLTPSENLKKLQALQSIREYLKKYEKLEAPSPGRDENFKKSITRDAAPVSVTGQ